VRLGVVLRVRVGPGPNAVAAHAASVNGVHSMPESGKTRADCLARDPGSVPHRTAVAPATSRPFFFSSEPLFPQSAVSSHQVEGAASATEDPLFCHSAGGQHGCDPHGETDAIQSMAAIWKTPEQVRGQEYHARFGDDHIAAQSSQRGSGADQRHQALEGYPTAQWSAGYGAGAITIATPDGEKLRACGDTQRKTTSAHKAAYRQRLVGWDVEPRKGMTVRLSSTGAAAFDEICLDISRNGPGVITKALSPFPTHGPLTLALPSLLPTASPIAPRQHDIPAS
jgi:hypothetical protein